MKNHRMIIGIIIVVSILFLSSLFILIKQESSTHQSPTSHSSVQSSSIEMTHSSSSEPINPPSESSINDLSTDVLFIYQITSPKIEKYWKSYGNSFGNLAFIQQVYEQTKGEIIVNGSGFSEAYDPIGLQIKDGSIYSGWADASLTNYAIESFVVMKDGSFRIYDYQTTPEEIVAQGGQDSFTFGQSMIKDGVAQASNGTADWIEYETVIGSNEAGDLFVCVSKIETDFQTIQEALLPLGLNNALVLDGGGSSQLMVNGELVKESDDSRPLPDFMVIN